MASDRHLPFAIEYSSQLPSDLHVHVEIQIEIDSLPTG
jgi:hypothetical protein